MEAAKLHINLQSTHEAGQRYLDAGNCFKKTDTEGISGRFFFLLLVLETVKTMQFKLSAIIYFIQGL